MEIFILIGVVLAVVFLIIFIVKCVLFRKHILENFKSRNVIVDGKKGSGKGLLFQYVINARKEPYYSNIDYGGKYEHIGLNDISVAPNTYNNFVNENIEICERKLKEKQDVYIDDAGVYLPSYMDSTLYKRYPSLPIYYALSRHTANHNIHCNVQNFGRVWKALREQADFYIHVKKTRKILFWLITYATTYDNYNSAVNYLEPVKTRILNKYSKAETDIYSASHGEIKSGLLIQWAHKVKYNTRAFEPILYGEQKRLYGCKKVKNKKCVR